MSAADCGVCEASGYRTCDECEGLVFDGFRDEAGRDVCAACR